jgi:uncharacterized protein (TIGR03437 family)
LVQVQRSIPNNQVFTGEISEAVQAKVRQSYGRLPLYFIENRGQLDSQVAYYIQGGDKSIYFTGSGLTFALTGNEESESSSQPLVHPASYREAGFSMDPGPQRQAQRWVVKLDFVDANSNVQPEGQEPTAAVISYFKGPRQEWATGLPTCTSLVYRDLWPGIDLVYTGTGSRLKYTFLVQPGADPDLIKLAYSGATNVRINDDGQLEVITPVESFAEDKPYVYQEVDGQRVEVAAAYSMEGEASEGAKFGFRIGGYDRQEVLVLDPVVLLYAGYIGGSDKTDNPTGVRIAVDATGNAYVAGQTISTEATFPVTVGPDLTFNSDTARYFFASDAFVAKINPSGTALVYAGYIGGEGDDRAYDIAVDSTGAAYVAGSTSSTNFPTTAGGFQPTGGFVTKLNPAGTGLVYSVMLVGGGSIAVDSTGAAYVAGSAGSTNFLATVGPDLTFNGGLDAFVAKVNPAGTALDYAGYIGGSDDESVSDIAVDSAGNAYVTGWTRSTEATFPVTVGPDLTFNGDSANFDRDAFVAKVNPSGTALVYAGYIGGSESDFPWDIAVDSAGNAYVTGETDSTEATFPVIVGPDLTYNGNEDAFVAKVNPSGATLAYAGYIGGSESEEGHGIAVDAAGNAYVTGHADSTEATFPVAVGPDLTSNGGRDAFVAKVNPSGTALLYAGYIGGSDSEAGEGIAVDSTGNAYVTGWTRSTEATFPVTVGPDLTFNGDAADLDNIYDRDTFVAKIGNQPLGPPALPANSVVNGASFRAATEPGGAIAPGSIVSIFGANLAGSVQFAASVPLPTTLGDTSVTFNGTAAPLFAATGGQINAQVPFTLLPGEVSVQVKRGSEVSDAQAATIASVSPGIFTTNQQGTGQGAVLIANTGTLAAPTGSIPGRETLPANRLEFISIFCSGLGDVTNRPLSGSPPSGGLSVTLGTPAVTIGGIEVQPSFSGLTSFVGLYQVDVQVPSNAPTGDAVDVVITIGSVSSNTVTIAVQ